jgi:UDP-N-acetylmuramoyl-L-alanyl-D-glutamate--2,6-diaminopimelate ligase
MKNFLRKNILYKIYKKFRSKFAAWINWYPSKSMKIIWITWTDGKTTTANLIHTIINDNLWKAVLLSTSTIRFWKEEFPNEYKMSSMDPMELHTILSKAKEEYWCEYAVLEVTSHWIDQFRFNDIEFDLWVLTNITEEHLDYHKTLDEYANVKKRLFQSIIKNLKPIKWAILPKDSEFWRKWIEELPFDKDIDYWVATNATLKWENIKLFSDHTEFDIKYLWKNYPVNAYLLWEFNVQNILASVWVWIILWISITNIIKSIQWFKKLTWRQERVDADWIIYFIDFAHTPNWLESILKFLSKIKWDWKIITVFWAPWNRDKYKRPKMWKIVEKYSDVFVVTDDDPDTENRYDIINQVVKWISKIEWEDFYIIPERYFAIKFVTEIAKKWDIVLLAGKWHEMIQLTNFWKRKWNDRDVLEDILNNK